MVVTADGNNNETQSPELSNYDALAKDVFKNLNPSTDIYFSQGPMDVLDHSCSKMGFGGKMCIDGTFKYEEEKDDQFSSMLPRFTGESETELLKHIPGNKSGQFFVG